LKIPGQVTATHDICEQFILNIKNLIETTPWEAKGIFGRKIVIDGKKRKLPSNVEKIYEECEKAIENKDWTSRFNEIARLGLKASEPHKFDFFGLRKRDEITQQFYDQFRQAFSEKEKIKQSKPSG